MISSINPTQPNTNFQALRFNKPKLPKSVLGQSQAPVKPKFKITEKISGVWAKIKNEYNSWDSETKEYFWKDLTMLTVLSVVIAQILRIVVPLVRWFNNIMDKLQ